MEDRGTASEFNRFGMHSEAVPRSYPSVIATRLEVVALRTLQLALLLVKTRAAVGAGSFYALYIGSFRLCDRLGVCHPGDLSRNTPPDAQEWLLRRRAFLQKW